MDNIYVLIMNVEIYDEQ